VIPPDAAPLAGFDRESLHFFAEPSRSADLDALGDLLGREVLLVVAREPSVGVNEIADGARITERYAYRLLSDLQKAGYVRRRRNGRRTRARELT
jgi:DNA-binding MarR family transcriptional regulator